MGWQKLTAVICLCFWTWWSMAQVTFPRNGVYDEREGHYAFTNATIHTTPTQKLDKATLLIKNGKIVEVGTSVSIPKDAVVVDLKGKHIYASFIELSSNYGLPKPVAPPKKSNAPQMISNKDGAYSWNEALKPEQDATTIFKVDAAKAKSFRKIGFGTVLTHQRDGMARGTSALVLLGDDNEHDMLLKGQAAAHYSFSKVLLDKIIQVLEWEQLLCYAKRTTMVNGMPNTKEQKNTIFL